MSQAADASGLSEEDVLLLQIARNMQRLEALALTRSNLEAIHNKALADQMRKLATTGSPSASSDNDSPRRKRRLSASQESQDEQYSQESVIYRSLSLGDDDVADLEKAPAPEEDRAPALARHLAMLAQILARLEDDALWEPQHAEASAEATVDALRDLAQTLPAVC